MNLISICLDQEHENNGKKIQYVTIEDKKDNSQNFIPDLAEEEWECENEFCKNVNSYYTHYCLSKFNKNWNCFSD